MVPLLGMLKDERVLALIKRVRWEWHAAAELTSEEREWVKDIDGLLSSQDCSS